MRLLVSRRTVHLTFSVLAIATLLISVRPATPSRSAAPAAVGQRAAAAKRKAVDAMLHSSLPFEANVGQTDPAAKFIARGVRYTVFFTNQGVLLRLADPQLKDKDNVVGISLVGARDSQIQGVEPLASRSHYFRGNSPKSWLHDVPHYGKVKYTGAYKDTNLVFYGRQGELEYDVVLGPGANPRDVVLQFSGTDHLSVNSSGDLVLGLRNGGEILQRRPKIYQQSGRKKTEIAGAYQILASNRVRFEVGGYDHGQPLVIDPVLTYASYLGGSGNGNDGANAIAVDASGNMYVAGYTGSTGFPTGSTTPIQASRVGGLDAFVAKLSADGSSLLYSTYLGGTNDDSASDIAVDSAGSAYLTGYTYSADFPATPGAFIHSQSSSSQSVFVAKIAPGGASLVYATYLGYGTGTAISVDSAGSAYIAGTAYCCTFPTTVGAYQRTSSYSTAFVTKVNSTGTGLTWSTLLGGTNNSSSAAGLVVDSSQNVYVTGSTYATTFPTTPGAFQSALAGSRNAFVSKFNAAGSALLYSTYLGGNSYDDGRAIAIDSLGYAYVAGYTNSPTFPTTAGVYQPSINGYDAFVTKLNQAGTGLVYSTHFGSYTQATAIAVDSSGNAYFTLSGGTIPVTSGAYNGGCCGGIAKLNSTGTVSLYASQIPGTPSAVALDSLGNAYMVGSTGNSSFPVTANAYQPSAAGASDAFITKLNSTGSALIYSTFLGGNGGDQGMAVAMDSSGNTYVTGSAGSLDFPVTTEAAKSPTGPYSQVFVSKFNPAGSALLYSVFVSGSGNDTGRAIAVDGAGDAFVTGQTNSVDFPTTFGVPQVAIGGGYDAFVFKLSPVGRLLYSTLLGGSSTDDGRGIAVDNAGNAYVAGNTSSPNFLQSTTIGNANSYYRVFVTKVNPAGSAFTSSTLLGGSSSQYVSGIAVDSSGSPYITGYTYSSDFPVTNGAYQTSSSGNQTGFVSKLNPALNGLVYSTYLGGSSTTSANAIAVDSAGSAYIVGSTYSSNFPVTAGAFQSYLAGNQNAFVTKLNPGGTALAYSTYLGGSSNDAANAVAVDGAGNAYVAGSSTSGNFPLVNGATIMEIATPNNYSTAFVSSLNSSGTALQYSTYMGGTTINGIASQPGSVAMVGTTSSTNMIGVQSGFQKTLASGSTNAFVAKISDPPIGCNYSVSPTLFTLPSDGASGTVTITANANCPWIASPDSTAYVQFNPLATVSGTGPGSIHFTLPSNSGGAGRTAMFTVAGQIITVVQAGTCTLGLSTQGASHSNSAIPSAFFQVSSTNCSWNAFTTNPWITIVSPYGSTGSSFSSYGTASLGYRLLPNPQAGSRTGTIYVGDLTFTVTQLGSASVQSTITNPSPGSILSDSTATFSWTTTAGATSYTLQVGSGAGLSNYCNATTSSTSATCANLPINGSLVYVTLQTFISGVGQTPVAYTYTAATPTLALLQSPTPIVVYPGPATTVLSSRQATFTWSRGVGADNYWLDVGTAYQTGDICAGPTTSTSSTCSNLPCTGGTVQVQLWTHYPTTGWQTPRNYVYQACTAVLASMTSPTPGSTLTGSQVTFKWSPGTGADNYWLDVGTSPGNGDLCAGPTTITQSSCNNIPTTGVPIYVQLYTHANGVWSGPPNAAYRYTYTAATLVTRAQLTSPLNNAALPGATTAFTWTAVPGADQYWLDVGNSPGQGDICVASTSGTNYTCNNIPVTSQITTTFGGGQLSPTSTFCWAGRTIYVQLWTHLPSGGWQTPVRYTLGPPSADYWLDVGTSTGQGNITAGVVSGTCTTVNIPSISPNVYVQLWTRTPAGTGAWYGPVRYVYRQP